MRTNHSKSYESRAERAILAWGRGVHMARMLFAAIFVPIMLFGAIVAEKARLVCVLAVPLLCYVVWREFTWLRANR